METAVKKLYEAMFLVDSARASDWDALVKTIETILKRADAEIVSIRNWAERKLAYEINSISRGTYVLCYFRADGDRIRGIEKDVQLSEQIMRVLILSAETREKEALEANATLQEPQALEVGDESAPAQAEDRTGEAQPLQKERDIEIQENIPAVEAEGEEQKADLEIAEKVRTKQKVDEAGELEHPAEPEAMDMSESEQPEQTETEKDTSV